VTGPPAYATDHNNLDAGRPLRFDDADPVALREQDLELGATLGLPQRRPLGFGVGAEYLYGFARNSQASVGITPSVGGRAGARSTAFDVGELSLGLMHQFHREYENVPAFALRGDVSLPTGRDGRGADFRLRAIWSRHVRQYDRIHLNLDLEAATDPARGDRTLNPGLIVGYSHPLGYPRTFTRTLIAELGAQGGRRAGSGPLVTAGVGIRQQVTPRSVLDIGIESDVAGFNGAPREPFRLIAGFSTGF
jgi:hypothetical protein